MAGLVSNLLLLPYGEHTAVAHLKYVKHHQSTFLHACLARPDCTLQVKKKLGGSKNRKAVKPAAVSHLACLLCTDCYTTTALLLLISSISYWHRMKQPQSRVAQRHLVMSRKG